MKSMYADRGWSKMRMLAYKGGGGVKIFKICAYTK